MAKPKIEVELTADAKGLKRGAKDAGEAVDDLGDKADKSKGKVEELGDQSDKTGARLESLAKNKANDNLGAVGEAAESLGIDLDNVDTKVLAAGAGFAVLGQQMADGIAKWGEYTHQIEQYSDAAGIGTEDASRFAQVFKQFGVEADDGIDALKTLGEEAGDAPEKFKQFGVEIERTSAGTVDLAGTMKNVAERFRSMQDPAQRAAMGAALFGDNWLRIAPILEEGSQGLDDLMSSVSDSAIVTKEALQEQRDFEKATRELKQTWDEFSMGMAREAIPKLTVLAKAIGTVSDKVQGVTGGGAGLGDFFDQFVPGQALLSAVVRDQRDSAKAAAESMTGLASSMADAAVRSGETAGKQLELASAEEQAADKAAILKARHEDVARAAQDAAKATEDQRKQLEQLRGLVESVAGAEISYQRAVIATTEAQTMLAEKQQAVTDAVNAYGDASPEAKAASDDYAKSLLDAQSAADAQAKAEVEKARQVALAAGQTFTAEQGNIVYRDSLNKVRDATNDPSLRTGLDGLIGLVDDTASAAGRAQQNLDAAEAAARRLAAVAAGVGTTSSGQIVGSADRLEGTIANQSIGRQSTARPQSVTINVNTPIGKPTEVVAWVREELRKAERAQR